MTNVNYDAVYMDTSSLNPLYKAVDYSKLLTNQRAYTRNATFKDYSTQHPYFYDSSSSALTEEEQRILSKLVEEEFYFFEESWGFLLRDCKDGVGLDPVKLTQAKYILHYDTNKHRLKALLFILNSVVKNFLSIQVIDDLFKNFSREIKKDKNLFQLVSPSHEYYFEKEDVASEDAFINQHRFYNWLSDRNVFTAFGESLNRDYLECNENTDFHDIDQELVSETYQYFMEKPYFGIDDPRNYHIDDTVEEVEIKKKMIEGIEKISALEFLTFAEIVNCERFQSENEKDEKVYTLQAFKENWGIFLSRVDVELFKKEFSKNMSTNSMIYEQHFYIFIFALLENDIAKFYEVYDYISDADDTFQYHLIADEEFYKNIREWVVDYSSVPWSLYKNIIEG